jgi:hypothetical protein
MLKQCKIDKKKHQSVALTTFLDKDNNCSFESQPSLEEPSVMNHIHARAWILPLFCSSSAVEIIVAGPLRIRLASLKDD